MRNIQVSLIIGLLVLIPFSLQAQNTWFETGTTWFYNYYINGPLFTENNTATFQISEQTTIAGQECAKMEVINSNENPFPCISVAPPYYFYESNDSIFYASDYDNTFRLAYDFGAETGDTWEFVVPVEIFETLDTFLVSVISVSSITISGQQLKVMELGYENVSETMHSTMFYQEYSVTERLGSDEQFFIPLGESGGEILVCDGEFGSTLQCFESNSLSYANPEFASCVVSTNSLSAIQNIEIYPNPSHGTFTIKSSESSDVAIRIFTLSGQQVYSQTLRTEFTSIELTELSAGIYLVQVETDNGITVGKFIIE